MYAQKRKIEIEKWFEGCRTMCDPGQIFVVNWIESNGLWFRKQWERALCKDCSLVNECGFKLKQQCDKFKNHVESIC